MIVHDLSVPGMKLIEPKVFGDARGFFTEMFQEERYAEHDISGPWVQDNLSRSAKNVLRGMHYQSPNPQGKLVSVLEGEVWDVGADIDPDSPTFGQWHGEILSAENKRQLWIPPGFAHGFCVLSDTALFHYKCTALYDAEGDAGIRWDDPFLAIDWPISDPILSEKDQGLPKLLRGC